MTLDGTFDQNNVINQLLQNESFFDVVTLITGKPDQSLHMYSVLKYGFHKKYLRKNEPLIS